VKRLFSPGPLAGVGVLLLAGVALILWLVPSGRYIVLPDKARPVAPLVKVADGHAVRQQDPGEIYFLAVFVRKATLLERLFPWLRDGATLVPADSLRTPGVSDKAQRQIDQRDMSQSQSIAAAIALRALGYKVVANNTGAQVTGVISGAPAVGKLSPTDVIVGLDGIPVRSPTELRKVMARHRPGDVLRLSVRSSTGLRKVKIRAVADPRDRSRAVIGIFIDQAAQIKLPFRVTIDPGNVVGPSAGLAFALEIMEKLGRDVDRGYRVAATGELDLNGEILPIGGAEQKAIEAEKSHVEILLVPAGDNAAVARRHAGKVRVIAVKTFQQALRSLATLPKHA
jgi:Lon-like protease